MSAHAHPRLTPEEYLEIERAAEFKNDYYDGHMYAMSGGSLRHAVVIANLSRALGNALEKSPCTVAATELRLRVGSGRLYTYPDVVIFSGAAKLADQNEDVLLNPTVITEVLSPSTERYDRGVTSTQYRTIESLQEYALVSQTEPRIELFHRQAGGQWLFTEFVGLDAFCRFESLDCAIALAVVYRNISFDDQEPAPDSLL
jgi:Uma2 family endonuclease